MAAASGPRTPIIVADDDASLREVMKDVLTEAGFFVFVAATGGEVLDIVRQGVRPCLIICDLLMPGITAAELMEALAADPRTRTVPIAIMTGSRGFPLPPSTYVLTKPFDLEQLVGLARSVCGGGENQSSSG